MITFRQPETVSRWYVAFHLKRGDWWGDWLIPGRFSHVSAFAYLPGPKAWLLIDHTPRRTGLAHIWPETEDIPTVPQGLGEWTKDCSILVADVRREQRFRFRVGLWCVIAVKDLLGSRSRALSPEGLWRDLVAHGAQIVHDAFTLAAKA